jgi:hypothetical protein
MPPVFVALPANLLLADFPKVLSNRGTGHVGSDRLINAGDNVISFIHMALD